MIAVTGLAHSYLGQNKISFPDLEIARGEPWLLLGDSGSGKTTLLHLMGGLLKSQHGRIEVSGVNISDLTESGLDHFRGEHLGFVFQKNHLINALSVRNNLRLAAFLAGLKQDDSRVDEVLAQLGLKEKADSRINDLSQGQAQRVSIARAVLNRPEVILADEPTSALDDKNCNLVIDLLLEMSNQNQSTLIVATHDQRLKAKIKNQIQL